MSAPLVVGAVCARPECGHSEDLHDGICFGTACECVRFVGAAALPVPVGPEPQASERGRLRAALIEALGNAHRTYPCPALGDRIWSGCVHYDEAGRMLGVGVCHSGRRADAVLAVRDAELERLKARVAELESRPSPADVLRRAADDLTAARPEHSDADEAWMDCPCEFADELRRTAALAGSVEGGCACPPADRPHQVGCPLDGVPGPDERPVDGLTTVFAPVASLPEPDGEFHAYLHHANKTPHDLPETGGAK